MNEYQPYRKTALQDMKPWHATDLMCDISVSEPDRLNGSPKEGDMIARSAHDPTDKWLVAEAFFLNNYVPA